MWTIIAGIVLIAIGAALAQVWGTARVGFGVRVDVPHLVHLTYPTPKILGAAKFILGFAKFCFWKGCTDIKSG